MTSFAQRAWSRFVRISTPFFTSESRWHAFGLLALLLALLLVICGLNVAINYVGRDFMTAIARRQSYLVYRVALLYLGVFALSAIAGGFARYAELVLGLRWREWLTRHFFHRYLSSRAYHRLNAQSDVDNPDERISQDLNTFTSTTLSFLVMATNSVITVVAFVGVLWSITPWLVLAGVLYPLLGTSMILFVGYRLVDLNHLQLKKEADFRFELVLVRSQANWIALDQAEEKEESRLVKRLGALIENYRSIIRILRNLRFVRGGYNYLDQVIPVLIVMPLYLRGEVEFGVLTQSAMAFSQIFNAFSLLAEKFQDLSTFAAVIGRVGALEEAIDESAEPSRRPLQVVEDDAPVKYQQVTLRAPQDDRVLVKDICLEVPRGRRVLVTGPNAAGQKALFQATAGLWDKGEGRIVHPAQGRVLFLPEHPYLVPGSLRDQFLTTVRQGKLTDERILNVLRAVGLEPLLQRVGGLDAEQDWRNALSLGERQRLAFARLLLAEPDFAFLDHAASALHEAERAEIYQLLARTGLTYVSVGDHLPSLSQYHQDQLELRSDGTWTAGPIQAKQEPPG
jgi:vitamin B12/bleomycin/antimicrobial peptide transport system ATP-binding/permease protein